MKNLSKLLILCSLLIFSNLQAQKIMSWNIQNLGESKYRKDTIIPQIADVIKSSGAEIIAIQEVVTSSYGDSCIIQLSKILGYNYTISEKTTGDGSERYAYLYKKSIKLNWSKLDKNLQDSIDREPFVASFQYNGKELVMRQVHLVPTSKIPQNEVAKLRYTDGIICGDFNLTCNHLIYTKLKTQFNSPLCGQGTSLKRTGEVSENNYDHFFVSKKYKIKSSQVYIYPYKGNRNKLSDHLPIIIQL
jgi:endonuclease/exonuclease/phosphatase family metal-dependent hydrolase